MAHVRDFEPILPDPQPYVEKALALYERAVREKRGRIVFISAELGGGKTDILNALAQALHHANPEPNFVAGFFRGGEYHRHSFDWQKNICLKKAVLAVGEAASLLSLLPGLYAFAASFIGQLLQTSVSTHEFGIEFKERPRPGKESADWLRKLWRSTAEEKPLVCLLDDWDEAQRFYWDDMLLGFSKEIAQDLPLLLFLTVKEPINLAAPEKDESGLAIVIKALIEKGLADYWPLRKLSRDEVANCIGPAAPGIVAKLHGVTGGNTGWVQELWREWRLNEIVVMNEADSWVWGAQHKATINLYDDILRDRLARLLKAETALGVEEAREVLACGALEGVRFTADAVALALGWYRDDLIDFLDETLVQSEDNPDGLLFEEDNVQISVPDGTNSTVWRYSFVSELHWLALERFGFANEERPEKSDSEKLEKTAALIKALKETYAPEERLVAAPLARLLRSLGHTEAAQHYQKMADNLADREVMRESALYLLALNKDDWEQWRCRQVAVFLIEAGWTMLNAFSYEQTRAVLEEAAKLAHRAKNESDEAYARYLCSFALHCEGDNISARGSANASLAIFRRIGNKRGVAVSLHLLAEFDYVEGRYDDALTEATQSLEIDREIGDQRGIPHALHTLVEIAQAAGRVEDARRHARQALEISQEVGNRVGTAVAFLQLAEIDQAEGRYDDARTHATQSLKINQGIGNRQGTAVAIRLLAQLDCAEGQYHDARIQAEQSLEIDEAIGNRYGPPLSLTLLAQIDYAEGCYDDACMKAALALEIDQEMGNRHSMAFLLHLLGEIAHKLKRPQEAVSLMSLSALILTEIGHTDVRRVEANLANLVATETYGEEQLVEMNQQVLDAYRKDGGKELIENTLARLREANR